MGDAAGKRADRLELLRLAQLFLEPLALGLGALALADVDADAGDAHWLCPCLRNAERGVRIQRSPSGSRMRIS